MLVLCDVNYTATLAGKTIHNKSIIGRSVGENGGDWKVLYFQETKFR
jgi:hypothetical protein